MAKIDREQQLTLVPLTGEVNTTTSHVICKDFFGNKISIGDYVVGITGIPKAENREGIVTEFIELDYGIFIKIQTLGGQLVAHSDYPHNYAVEKK
ncbi:MAG: hypothetical protein IKK43_00410 [Clostridia bacterium]|nr:hypothetical protein [Clostridia bacterium]